MIVLYPILRGGAPPQGSGGDNGVKHKNKPTSLTKKRGVIPSPTKKGRGINGVKLKITEFIPSNNQL